MGLNGLLQAIQASSLGTAVSGDSGNGWLFPNIETIHVMSITMVFGSILMVDLRLLGVATRNSPVSRLSREVLPYTWTAFIIAMISGVLLFTSKAPVYFHNLQFQLKFLFMALAGVNMLTFHLGAYRHVLDWDNALPPPLAARFAGAVSIALWVAVIFMGRWIGFKT
jgi:hypothetical protein